MSYNKKTFTNCFGEEMTRQIDEVEEKLGVEIDKGKFVKAKAITITKDELNILEEALQSQYDSNFESDHEMLRDEINKSDCDWGFASSLCYKFEQVHEAFELIKTLKERNKKDDEKKSETEPGSNSE